MAYIGKTPIVGNFQKCDALSASGTADYTLQVSSTNVVPESVNHMIVSLNGVIQQPTTAYTVSGSTLSFASSLTSSDTIDFVMLLGNVLDIGTPSDATVTNAKLGTDVISGETDIGGALADADLILVDDGAGGTLRKSALSRMKTYVWGGLAVADQWRVTSSYTGDTDPIQSNLEQIDGTAQGSLGSAMAVSSGIWTFPSTGFWWVQANAVITRTGEAVRYSNLHINATTNNSSYNSVSTGGNNIYNDGAACKAFIQCHTILDVTDVANVKVKFNNTSNSSSVSWNGSSTENNTYFTFIKLGDT